MKSSWLKVFRTHCRLIFTAVRRIFVHSTRRARRNFLAFRGSRQESQSTWHEWAQTLLTRGTQGWDSRKTFPSFTALSLSANAWVSPRRCFCVLAERRASIYRYWVLRYWLCATRGWTRTGGKGQGIASGFSLVTAYLTYQQVARYVRGNGEGNGEGGRGRGWGWMTTSPDGGWGTGGGWRMRGGMKHIGWRALSVHVD